MKLWRLTQQDDPAAAFSGDGGLYTKGRWNHRGTRVVYTAAHLSLAALEQLVRFRAEEAARAWFYYEVDIPDADLQPLYPLARLPANWRTSPAPTELADLAAPWFRSQASVGLIVPSVVVPEENNALLNPEHPRFGDLLPNPLPSGHEFRFDERLIEAFAVRTAGVAPRASRPRRTRPRSK